MGRPLGSKNKLKSPPMIIQEPNEEISSKPIFIEVSDNSDVIKAMVQFAHQHQVSITVLSASGTISSATLHHPHSPASAFTLYGPFTLISLTGTYINNTAFSISSSTSSPFNLVDPAYCFRISFCTRSGQSFNGIVGGKVVADNGVIVTATVVNKLKFYKDVINNNNSNKEQDNDNNSPNDYEQGSTKNMCRFNVVTPYT